MFFCLGMTYCNFLITFGDKNIVEISTVLKLKI